MTAAQQLDQTREQRQYLTGVWVNTVLPRLTDQDLVDLIREFAEPLNLDAGRLLAPLEKQEAPPLRFVCQ